MKTVCLDFDGVLNTYDGWKGEDNLFEPRRGSQMFVQRLLCSGYDVVIHSTRDPNKIANWLKENEFPNHDQIKVSKEKPPAIVYIDDRAIRFTGDYDAAYEAIKDFKVYWEKK